jgi:AhpD family alkylhydroperoxidase
MRNSQEVEAMSIYTEQVNELVAIGAAIAANCEPCLKYHYDQARKLGVSDADMLAAVRMAQRVKQAPAGAMLELAGKLLGEPVLPDAAR